jgi:hypothetical protein
MHQTQSLWHSSRASRNRAKAFRPPAAESYTVGETIRGVAELSICIAVFVLPVLFPHLLALPLMATGAFIVAGLAVWDDCARMRAARERRRSREEVKGDVQN